MAKHADFAIHLAKSKVWPAYVGTLKINGMLCHLRISRNTPNFNPTYAVHTEIYPTWWHTEGTCTKRAEIVNRVVLEPWARST